MDTIAHALTGAALGEAGLKRVAALGMPALVLSANVRDVDLLGLLAGENLPWRRGWTHGPLALALLPTHEVVENAAAKNVVVPRHRESEESPTRNERTCRGGKRSAWRSRSVRTTGLRLQCHTLGARVRQPIGLFHSRRQEGLRPEGPPLTEPGGDRVAVRIDRTLDPQIERPRVLTVKERLDCSAIE